MNATWMLFVNTELENTPLSSPESPRSPPGDSTVGRNSSGTRPIAAPGSSPAHSPPSTPGTISSVAASSSSPGRSRTRRQ
jgi:hypothetical protein